jgi:hypothetical protein
MRMTSYGWRLRLSMASDSVARHVGAVAQAGQHAQGHLLVDDVVLGEQNAQWVMGRCRRVKGSLAGTLRQAHCLIGVEWLRYPRCSKLRSTWYSWACLVGLTRWALNKRPSLRFPYATPSEVSKTMGKALSSLVWRTVWARERPSMPGICMSKNGDVKGIGLARG